MRSSRCWIIAALAVCTGSPTSAKTSPARPAKVSAAQWPSVERKELPRSHVPVVLGVEVPWAQQQLEERIPRQLHQEANREVAPGVLLDARVTREPIAIGFRDEGVVVSTPIVLELEARSRIGSIAVPLGRCRTTADFELVLATRLSHDGRLGRPTPSISLRAPCRLAAFDVTPIIQHELARHLTAAEQQIATYLDRANEQLTRVYADLFRTVSDPVAGCARFIPERLLQTPIANERDIATMRFIAEGRIDNECRGIAPPLVRIEQTTGPFPMDLAWARRIPMDELSALVSQRLATDGIANATVKIRSVRLNDVDQLAVELHLPKHAGWILAHAECNGPRLRLVNLRSRDARLLGLVRSSLETFELPIDTIAVDTLAQKQLLVSNELSMVLGASTDLKAPFAIAESALETAFELQLDPDALVVVVHRRERR